MNIRISFFVFLLVIFAAMSARGQDCYLVSFEPTDIPPGATLSNYVNAPDIGLNSLTYDFITSDWDIRGTFNSCSAERIESEWEDAQYWTREYYRQNFGVTVKDETGLLVLAEPTADGGYKRLDALELYRGGNILGCEVVPQECIKNAYCKGVTLESMAPAYAEQLRLQKEIIDRKCGPIDLCGGKKIPLPIGTPLLATNEAADPVLGTDPEAISPLGFGDGFENGDMLTFRVGLCPFKGPVNILFWHDLYALNANNKVQPFSSTLTRPEDIFWKTGVTGAIDEELAGDFGGLLGIGQHLPKGDHTFSLIVFPSDAELDNDTSFYLWSYNIGVSCPEGQGGIVLPGGKKFFFITPMAIHTTGLDPTQFQPFAIGPYAVGGDILVMSVDFCPFDPIPGSAQGSVDTHFGMYCPLEDPLNVYFVNGNATTEDEIYQKVPFLSFLFAPELPAAPFADHDQYDINQDSPTTFFAGLTAELPRTPCYYIAAITPADVRDKFYAWVLLLDVDIKDALAALLLEGHE